MQTKTSRMADVVDQRRVLDSFDRVQDTVGGLVASTDPARFGDPTPCKEWDVRRLLEHLVDINLRYAAMTKGEPYEGVGRIDDPISAYRDAAKRAHSTFHAPGMVEKPLQSPWGEIPGAVLMQHAINELIAHGWDLAKATGRSTDLVPDLAEESLRVWRAWFDGDVGRMDDFFEPEKSPPRNATPADRVAAYLGREA